MLMPNVTFVYQILGTTDLMEAVGTKFFPLPEIPSLKCNWS